MTTHQFYDVNAESALIGATLVAGANYHAIDQAVEAGVTSSTFWQTNHGLIFDAITTIHDAGQAVDAVTVAHELDARGQLHADSNELIADKTGHVDWGICPITRPLLTELALSCPAISNAPTYSAIIVGHARDRWIYNQLTEATNGSFANYRSIIDNVATTVDGWDVDASNPFESDLAAYLAGDITPMLPELIPRDDGATNFLYRPGITWLTGEPGKGKSLMALWWCLHEIVSGRHVFYLDHEGTEMSLLARLEDMGAAHDAIIQRFHYINRVGETWTPAAMAELRALLAAVHPSLVIIDAVAGAMAAEGLNPESNPDIEKWSGGIPALIKGSGAAGLFIDHLNKNVDTRGGYATGGYRKKAVADASYELVMFSDAGIGITGHGKLVVNKDRHGALMAHSEGRTPQTIAVVTIASEADDDGGHLLSIMLAAPAKSDATGKPVGFEPTWYMQQVSLAVERHTPQGGITKTELRELIGAQSKYTDKAIVLLVDSGHIKIADVKGAAKPYVSVKQYRQLLAEPEPDDGPSLDDPTLERY